MKLLLLHLSHFECPYRVDLVHRQKPSLKDAAGQGDILTYRSILTAGQDCGNHDHNSCPPTIGRSTSRQRCHNAIASYSVHHMGAMSQKLYHSIPRLRRRTNCHSFKRKSSFLGDPTSKYWPVHQMASDTDVVLQER